MSVKIRQTHIGGSLGDFLEVVEHIYRDDPMYVRPLNMDLEQRLGEKNPFLEHGEATIFTAYHDNRCVGRCTAQVDRSHLERYRDDVGFFGFLDTVDDQEVATALLDAARRWLAARGMKRIRGPFSLNINEEAGCLIDGFDTPPMIMTGHHRPYQGGLIEGAGFQKIKDLYAWRYTVGEVPQRAAKVRDELAAMPELQVRHVDTKHIERDVRLIMEVFNDAWSDNWGFVPLSEAELRQMAKDLRPILVPEVTYIATINGKPAAVALALPNINEVIGDLHGKLFPLGLPKLLYRLKVKHPKTARLIILGIRKEFRHVRKYAGLSIYLYALMNDSGKKVGYEWGELSWTLEDNGPVNVGIKFMGGKIYKKYRIYERDV